MAHDPYNKKAMGGCKTAHGLVYLGNFTTVGYSTTMTSWFFEYMILSSSSFYT